MSTPASLYITLYNMRGDFYQEILLLAPFGYALHEIVLDKDNNPIDYIYKDINQAFLDLTGLQGLDVIGKRVTELIPNIRAGTFDWIKEYGEIALKGGKKEFEQYLPAFDRWYKILAYSTEPGKFISIFTDISREKATSTELERFFSVNLDLLCIANVAGRFVKLNQAWSTVLGYSLEELYSQTFINFVHPDDVQATLKSLEELEKNNDVVGFVNRYRHKNGSYRYIEWQSHPYGELIYAAARDISALKVKELEYTTLINTSNDAFMSCTTTGEIQTSNSNFSVYTLSHQKTINLNAIHPSLLNKLKKHPFLRFETKLELLTGENVAIEASATFLQVPNELILFFLKDISGELRLKSQLETSQQRFELALHGTDAGLWDWDMKNDTVFFSSLWKSMLGYSDAEILPNFEAWRRLWHPDDAARIMDTVNAYISGKINKYEVEHRLLHKDGTWKWILTRGEILRDEKRKPIRWIGTNIDITKSKENEQKLRDAIQAAEFANEVKDKFLGTISHEIRTPLNAVIGYSDLLTSQELVQPAREYAANLRDAAQHLLSLVNDVMDFTEIESGAFELEEQELDLHALLEQCSAMQSYAVKSKNLVLELKIDEGLPRYASFDSTRLRQVLNHLLSNAVKFTESGTIILKLAFESLTEPGNTSIFTFAVEDSGSGLDQAYLKKYFKRSATLDTSLTRKHGGLGLGLSLAKMLVNVMGGELEYTRSSLGGSKFSFALRRSHAPLKKQIHIKPQSQETTSPGFYSGQSLLLVDDAPPSIMLLSRIISARHPELRILTASSAEDALLLLQNCTPALIFADYRMPGMSGLDLLRKVRSQTRNSRIPIIIISGSKDAGESMSCLSAGASDYVNKPFSHEVIMTLLYRHLPPLNQTKAAEVRNGSESKETTLDFVQKLNNLISLVQLKFIRAPEELSKLEPQFIDFGLTAEYKELAEKLMLFRYKDAEQVLQAICEKQKSLLNLDNKEV